MLLLKFKQLASLLCTQFMSLTSYDRAINRAVNNFLYADDTPVIIVNG